MTSDIQQVALARSTSQDIDRSVGESEKKDVVRADISDIEAEAYNGGDSADENKLLLHQPDRTELTPAEAFKWDVHGDQSPCK